MPDQTSPAAILPADGSLIHRRGVIQKLGMVSVVLAAGTSPLLATSTARRSTPASSERVDLRDLSPEWVRLQGPALREYCLYVHSLRLRNVTVRQLVIAHAKNRGGLWNTLPPKKYWNRMGYTLRVVDRIGDELGMKASEITSAYRSPGYNARCPGAARGSYHQANVALDIQFPIRASQVASASRSLRDRGLFKGGVGSYPNFTHVDTRGENVSW